MSENSSEQKPSIIKFSGSTAAIIKRCQAQARQQQRIEEYDALLLAEEEAEKKSDLSKDELSKDFS